MSAIQEYLQHKLISSSGDEHTQWLTLEDLHEQRYESVCLSASTRHGTLTTASPHLPRLWHQMTGFVQGMIKSSVFAQGGILEFCNRFLSFLFDR